MTTVDLMNELTERLAADPRGQVDPRAWRALLTYAPLDLLKRPVAFRYKDGSDQWAYTENEAETQHALDTGHDSQALFVRDGTGHDPDSQRAAIQKHLAVIDKYPNATRSLEPLSQSICGLRQAIKND